MSHAPSSASDDGENNGHGGSQSESLSTTPTPLSHMHRSLSQGTQASSGQYTSQSWSSAAETPSHHHQGTSYFTSSSPTFTRQPPPPILMRSSSAHSIRRGMRSTSVSSTARGEAFSEAEEENANGDRQDSDEQSDEQPSEEEEETGNSRDEEDPITLKERQSLINVEHPFGLPIWKPALYKKSRSVTRYADEALHLIPSAQAERHLRPGNLFWVVFFGWWLSLVCFFISALLYIVPQGGKRYASLVFGLGWYIAWPFGKYVEGVADDIDGEEEEEIEPQPDSEAEDHERRSSGSVHTVRANDYGTIRGADSSHQQSTSWVSTEQSALLSSSPRSPIPAKSYGALSTTSSSSSIGLAKQTSSSDFVGKSVFWICFTGIIAPLMLFACLVCWFLVLTIPMAKLNWALIKHMFEQPDTIRFCAAPLGVVVGTAEGDHIPASESPERERQPSEVTTPSGTHFSVKHARLTKGQRAPSGTPCTAVLLCTYRAAGLKYYKYTVGGVNIMFVNLMAVVFFAIFDWAVFLTWVEELEKEGRPVPGFLHAVASPAVIFVLSLLSVIPLSYFIGMAVASISAQSSIGMGAVINATFGSIIEILLYSIALDRGKGRLVEGSIVGSLLAGVLLMPGMSMVSSAMRRKEQRFNAKSAGVTSMMLIMAIIGALAPTLFYQTYGNFQLLCTGCPKYGTKSGNLNKPWVCDQCYYRFPDPANDPFFQSTVKNLMFFCAAILLFSYLVGLWFSLRTHASQIWQNPQQLLHSVDLPVNNQNLASNTHGRQSLYHKLVPSTVQRTLSHRASKASSLLGGPPSPVTPTIPIYRRPMSPVQRRVSYAPSVVTPGSTSAPVPNPMSGSAAPTVPTPLLESVDQAVRAVKNANTLHLPETMTTDDFTRAVAVATVSALRHQQQQQTSQAAHSPARMRTSSGAVPGDIPIHGDAAAAAAAAGSGHGGHDAPSWSRFTSASVLLACTALYAIIAEILVDVIDVILGDSGLDEKFLGVTLLALVPNTTEFMNAISFALNGNIALSMEIGSAYALQVCLLQIPAMVAFSAWWFPERLGEVAHTFSLIFPRWDVIAIILSMFLLTYTYIEAKSNYHRGSILILSYLVLIAGFYYAPRAEEFRVDPEPTQGFASSLQEFNELTFWELARWYLTSL